MDRIKQFEEVDYNKSRDDRKYGIKKNKNIEIRN